MQGQNNPAGLNIFRDVWSRTKYLACVVTKLTCIRK